MNEKNLPAVLQTAIKMQSINPAAVNLMLPTQSFGEYDKGVLEVVTISSNEKEGEVFKIGGKKALGKIPLQKIGNALGIIWDPKSTTVLESSPRKSRAKATGAIKKPNGEYIIISEEKTVDVDIYEEEQWMAKTEEAEKGKLDGWEELPSGKSKPIFKPWVSEQEKKDHIEREVKKAVLQYKKFKDERAMTGAKTRVIRALIAIKSAYTDAELSKPFVFPKVILDTNKLLASPEMRQVALDKMTGNINSIFGQPRNITPDAEEASFTTLSAPEEMDDEQPAAQPGEPDFEDEPQASAQDDSEKINQLGLMLEDYLEDPAVKKSPKMIEAINKRFDMIRERKATVQDLEDLIKKIENALSGGRK